jgi:ABC-type antimicrobial peptide transport system permease subunit
MVLAGIGGGIVLALLAGRLIAQFLYGVAPADPVTLASVAMVLAAVTFLAAVVPAQRASHIDPVVALRYD